MSASLWRCVLALTASTTLAQAAEPRYWIDLQEGSPCPPLSQLHQQISDRDERLQAGVDGARFDIDVCQDDTGYFTASVRMPDGSSRQVKAADCDDIGPALAFIVVMSVEPERAAAQAENDSAPERKAEGSEPSGSWRHYVGATAALSGGRSPEALPTGGVFLELGRPEPWRMGVRASAVFGANAFSASPGKLNLQLLGGILEFCPLGIAFLSICSGMEAGALRTRAGEQLSSERQVRFSLAARLGVQLRHEWRSWFGEIAGGFLLPVTLDELVIVRGDGTEQTIYRPGASGYAGIGIGYRL